MWDGCQAVDADGHIMEPAGMWREFIDPAYRDDCIRVARDPLDGDKLIVGGAPSRLIRRLGGCPPPADGDMPDWNRLERTDYIPYEASCTPASFDPLARLRWLHDNGIDATFLFPSLGLIWPREVDPWSPYANAHCRAYNRWLTRFVACDSDRLWPVAQLPHEDPAPLTAEVLDLAGQGIKHVLVSAASARLFCEAGYDRMWRAAEEASMAIHLHKVAIPHFLALADPGAMASTSCGRFFGHVLEVLPGQLSLTAILDAGLPDRFPGLRFAFHECNAAWLPAWLDRATESYETLGKSDRPALPPRHHLVERDAFFFSLGLGEDLSSLSPALSRGLMAATDYPHPGTPPAPRQAWTEHLAQAPAIPKEAVLGGNALRLWKG